MRLTRTLCLGVLLLAAPAHAQGETDASTEQISSSLSFDPSEHRIGTRVQRDEFFVEIERQSLLRDYLRENQDHALEDPEARFLWLVAPNLTRGKEAPEVSQMIDELGLLEHESTLVRASALTLKISERPARRHLAGTWRAFDELVAGDYAPLRLAQFAPVSQDMSDRFGDEQRESRAAEVALSQALLSSHGELNTIARRFLWNRHIRRLADSDDAEVRRAFCTALRSDGEVDAWIREMSLGNALVEDAWDRRGSGFATVTTDDQFQGFYQLLERARPHLLKALEIDPNCPEPAAELIRVTMGGVHGPGETVHSWYRRSASIQPDDQEAHRALRWAIHPRWGGSIQLMSGLAKWSAGKQHRATHTVFYSTYTLVNILDEMRLLGLEHRVWIDFEDMLDTIDEGLREALETHPRASTQWVNSVLAVIAFNRGQDEYAAQRLLHAGGELRQSVVNDYHEVFSDLETRILTRGSPELGQRAIEADKLQLESRWDQAHAIWAQLLERLPEDTDPHTRKAFESREIIARQTDAFLRGESVSLIPAPGFPATLMLGEGWSVNDERVLSKDVALDSKHQLVFAPEFGDRYVMEATVVTAPTNKCWFNSGFGVAYDIDYNPDHNKVIRFRSVLVWPRRGQGSCGLRWGRKDYPHADIQPVGDIETRPEYHIRLVRDGRRVRAEVNGTLIHDGALPSLIETDEPLNPRVGLYSYRPFAKESEYRAVTIRQLRADDLPPEVPDEI